MTQKKLTNIETAAKELRKKIHGELQEKVRVYIGRKMTPTLYGKIATIIHETLGSSDYSKFYKQHVAVEVDADGEKVNVVTVTMTPKTKLGRDLLWEMRSLTEGK